MYKRFQESPTDEIEVVSGGMYPGLNAAKGILVFMVIITHALPDSMLLYFFYLFHMPVFLSISGFLLKKTAFRNGYRNYFKRAAQRLLVPWGIASLIYLPFSLTGRSLSQLTITDLLYPFYHLWYVPAYFIGVTLCYGVTQLAIPIKPVFFITASFTFIWYVFFRESHLPVSAQPLYWLGEKRFYAYVFFFFLGHTLRNRYVRLVASPRFLCSIVVTAFIIIVAAVFNNVSSYLIGVPYLVFNTGLVLLLLLHGGSKNWLQNKFVLLLNRQSLGIYLYHPLVMFIIYQMIGDPQKKHISNIEGFGIGITTVLITIGLVLLVKKWTFANRYVFGIIRDEKEQKVEEQALVAA